MLRSLLPPTGSFLTQVRRQQRSFAPHALLVQEIEDDVYNYKCVSATRSLSVSHSPLDGWSAATQRVVQTLQHDAIEDLLLRQQERVVTQARRNTGFTVPQIGCDGRVDLRCFRRPTEDVEASTRDWTQFTHALSRLVPSFASFCASHQWMVDHFTVLTARVKPMHPITPSTGLTPMHPIAPSTGLTLMHPITPSTGLTPIPAALAETYHAYSSLSDFSPPLTDRGAIHHWSLLHTVQFPEKRLLQYDCGKLQVLSALSSPP